MSVIPLRPTDTRFAAEQSAWSVSCDVAAIGRLANDGVLYTDLELMEMRRSAYELIAICSQIEANMKLGSK